jgi:pyridinium-3,5-bisthiocarboxylic acid mononucleotide nickel chelatase
MNPQMFGYGMEKLFAAGALDVYLPPIYMKKNRPATLLGVIARRQDEAALADLILRETTTLGLRVQPIYRYEAQREFREVETPYGSLKVKLKIVNGKVLQAMPEYVDCLRLSKEHNVSLMEIYAAIGKQI